MGGYVDETIMRITEILLAFPGLLLALGVVVILGPGMINLTISIGISGIPRFARIIRGGVLSAKENIYVEAARAVGVSDLKIIARHILPNILAPFLVYATLRVGSSILIGTGLSFLGLGAEPPTPEWGVMLSDGRDFMRNAWWLTTFPGMAIMMTVISVNLLGDGLRDVLDPRLK
jgi:peptide/nickel transport system permease protein